jgi:hypothetical protein
MLVDHTQCSSSRVSRILVHAYVFPGGHVSTELLSVGVVRGVFLRGSGLCLSWKMLAIVAVSGVVVWAIFLSRPCCHRISSCIYLGSVLV